MFDDESSSNIFNNEINDSIGNGLNSTYENKLKKNRNFYSLNYQMKRNFIDSVGGEEEVIIIKEDDKGEEEKEEINDKNNQNGKMNNELNNQNKINKNKILTDNSPNNKIYDKKNNNEDNINLEKDKDKERKNSFRLLSQNDTNFENVEKPVEISFLEKKRKKSEISPKRKMYKNKKLKEKENKNLLNNNKSIDKKGPSQSKNKIIKKVISKCNNKKSQKTIIRKKVSNNINNLNYKNEENNDVNEENNNYIKLLENNNIATKKINNNKKNKFSNKTYSFSCANYIPITNNKLYNLYEEKKNETNMDSSSSSNSIINRKNKNGKNANGKNRKGKGQVGKIKKGKNMQDDNLYDVGKEEEEKISINIYEENNLLQLNEDKDEDCEKIYINSIELKPYEKYKNNYERQIYEQENKENLLSKEFENFEASFDDRQNDFINYDYYNIQGKLKNFCVTRFKDDELFNGNKDVFNKFN